MTVIKHFDIKVKIDSEIVSQYIEKADADELKALFETTDAQSMEKFVAKYLQKMQHDNPEKFNRFVGVKEKSKETVIDTVKGEQYKIGDIVFKARQSFGGYIIGGYDKCYIKDITPYYVVIVNDYVAIKIAHEMFKQMIDSGEIYIFRRNSNE